MVSLTSVVTGYLTVVGLWLLRDPNKAVLLLLRDWLVATVCSHCGAFGVAI